MSTNPTYSATDERLQALQSYQVLDTLEESDFDDLTTLAAAICHAPVALISLVDEKRQWFKSHKGLLFSETPIEQSFCAHAIVSANTITTVKDATKDSRFKDNPLVTGDPHIVFYAGVPLINEDGFALGTLCVIDSCKRTLSPEQETALKVIARQVIDKLELRRKIHALQATNEALQQSQLLIKQLNENLVATCAELEAAQVQQLRTNEQLAESEELNKIAIAQAQLGTWHIDAETGAFMPSEKLKEFFGFYPPDEMSIEAAIRQIRKDHRDNVLAQVNAAMAAGASYEMEYPVIGYHDEKLRWVKTTGKLNPSKDGKPAYYSGAMLNITEQKQDEQRKSDFIGMVSHELKTPLTSIHSYIQLLHMEAIKNKDGFAIDIFGRVVKQVTKMTTMINGFLNMSRLESGKIHIDKTLFDLSKLLKEAEEESHSIIKSHTVVFAPVAPVMVLADRDKIGQIIHNLISNAVKYSPGESTIHVACKTVQSYVQVSISDKGMGVHPKDIGKLFDRYYRVEESKSIAGFGIGLYLCAEIIQRHDGKIWVESELGKGSTFTFSLPVMG